MAAFLICSPLRPYFTQAGEIASGGYLAFYEGGTTTPTDVYGDEALSVNNGTTVDLDAAGFPDAEVWGDADLSYKVRVYTSDDVLIDEQDDITGNAGGFTLPSGTDGQFLGLVAGVAAFQDIIQVPDPLGHSGKVLGTDGVDPIWQEVDDTEAGTVTHQTVTATETLDIDLSAGLSVTLNQDVSITALTFSNVPSGAGVLSIRRVKDATATARTIAWPASVKWPGGTAPTLSSTSGAIDEISLKFADSIFTGTFQLAFA